MALIKKNKSKNCGWSIDGYLFFSERFLQVDINVNKRETSINNVVSFDYPVTINASDEQVYPTQ